MKEHNKDIKPKNGNNSSKPSKYIETPSNSIRQKPKSNNEIKHSYDSSPAPRPNTGSGRKK